MFVRTERQIARQAAAIKEAEFSRSKGNNDRTWIGVIWNIWKQQALSFGSDYKSATEAADAAMFRIPESEDREEPDIDFEKWIALWNHKPFKGSVYKGQIP